MVKEVVFTSKRMKDCRFRKTEEAILSVFFDEYKKGSSIQKIAKKVGMGRSTMYIHHHTMREMIPDWEKYILAEYHLAIKKRMQKREVQIKSLYLDTLLFILKNRNFFELFLKFEDRDIFIRVLAIMKPRLEVFMRLPKDSDKVFRIYASEVVEVIFEWGRAGFSETEIGKVLSDVMYLTNTCRDRLILLG